MDAARGEAEEIEPSGEENGIQRRGAGENGCAAGVVPGGGNEAFPAVQGERGIGEIHLVGPCVPQAVCGEKQQEGEERGGEGGGQGEGGGKGGRMKDET